MDALFGRSHSYRSAVIFIESDKGVVDSPVTVLRHNDDETRGLDLQAKEYERRLRLLVYRAHSSS